MGSNSTVPKFPYWVNSLKLKDMVGPARFERATLCLEGRCSIQLSYGPVSFILAAPHRFGPGFQNRILRRAEGVQPGFQMVLSESPASKSWGTWVNLYFFDVAS